MADDSNNGGPDPEEGPGKGDVYFKRAAAVAATGNFDYAIDMYIQGLYREPSNMEEHKKLREVGFHRKVNGGKPAGGLFGAKTPYKGKRPKEGMLNAEFLLAKDVGNINHMLQMIRNAVLCNLPDVVAWIGPILQEANRTSKSPKLELYIDLAELYAKVNDYEKATQAAEQARIMKPTDGDLDAKVKQYAAMATMTRGNYDKNEGGFQQSIKDAEVTKKLNEEENLGKSEEYRRRAVEEARRDYEKNPTEMQVVSKYAKALSDMGDAAHDALAIDVLLKAFEATKIYRFKVSVGDIRIRQFRHENSRLKEAVRQHPEDEKLRAQLEQLQKDRLAFEVTEYRERAEHFPTDLIIRYELGRRLYDAGLYDEAIGSLQDAQNNPKYRVEALHLLGRAFMAQGMLPEALDTLKLSIEAYDNAMSGDAKSKGLHYWYGRALEESGKIKPAIDMYSQVIRWDFNYLDTKKRLAELRTRAEG